MGMDPDEVDRMVAGGSASDDWREHDPIDLGYSEWWKWAWFFGMLLAAAVLTVGVAKWARADSPRVDAAIVTGIDVSTSVATGGVLPLQLDGIAKALQAPEILAAIAHGRHHRIAVAVYLWSDGACPLVGQWRVIATAQDADLLAAEMSDRAAAAKAAVGGIGLTDLSAAMLCGGSLLQSAPFAADRSVLNILTNGTDNVGDDADVPAARRALLDAGINVNAVALPGGAKLDELEPYLRAFVAAGPMSFVLTVSEEAALIDVLRRKFVGDLAMLFPVTISR